MSYIGNSPSQTAFLTDQFSGTGSQTAFTMSVAPANTASCIVAVSGVLQDPSTYAVAGTTLNFTVAPPTGSGNISVRYLGIPASGVTTTAYRTVTEFTATASQTTFTPPSYTVGFLNVYRNGVLLGSADYTATNGTTVVLATGCVAGDLVTTESFLVSSVLNAIPNTTGSISSSNLPAGLTITSPTISSLTSASATNLTLQSAGTTAVTIDTSQNVGIGTTSQSQKLHVVGNAIASNVYFGALTSSAGTISSDPSLTGGYFQAYGLTSGSPGTVVLSATSTGSISLNTNGTTKCAIDSTGNVSITQTPGKYTVYTTGGATSIANGGTVDFSNASGMLVVNSFNTGGVSIYLFGGGSTAIIGSVVGTVGSTAYNSSIAGYRWTNNSGSTGTFGFFFVRTRPTA